MGFRCPVCKKDFGRDNNKLLKHFELSEDCGKAKDFFSDLFNKALDNIENAK